jgi:hypothetical protein
MPDGVALWVGFPMNKTGGVHPINAEHVVNVTGQIMT